MTQIARSIDMITAEIKVFEQSMKESVARHAWEIGKRLNEAKGLLPHGQFTHWLELNFEFTDRYAQEFMKFNNQNPNLNSVFNDLEWTKIRQVMSLPESIDRQDFIEQSHNIPSTGESKTVDEMTVRELREIKETLKKVEQAKLQSDQRAERASSANVELEHRIKQKQTQYELAIQQHSEQQEKLLHQIDQLKKKETSDSPETIRKMKELQEQLQKTQDDLLNATRANLLQKDKFVIHDTLSTFVQTVGKHVKKLELEVIKHPGDRDIQRDVQAAIETLENSIREMRNWSEATPQKGGMVIDGDFTVVT